MIPSLLAKEVEESLKGFVKNDFPVASSYFLVHHKDRSEPEKSIIEDFVNRDDSLVKGPWVQIQLPYRQSEKTENIESLFTRLPLKEISPNFRPYDHQVEAFKRLTLENPLSTVIATGTGSGKTECFIYPILDYCLRSEQKGIKAVIVYPMNALVTDQASRLADLIYKLSAKTKKQITAGIYIGQDIGDERRMSAKHLISSRDEMRKNPPDILLTNYKMLDYLVMRPQDQNLWGTPGKENPLKYLVVDELHTFDGAQGTDLSCLVRRLKERVGKQEPTDLACVGTSATVGGKTHLTKLCGFASSIFATTFDPAAIIFEERLEPQEFIEECKESLEAKSPLGSFPKDLPDPQNEPYEEYLFKTAEEWFGKNYFDDKVFNSDINQLREQLSLCLPRLGAFSTLIEDVKSGANLKTLSKNWLQKFGEDLRLTGRDENEKLQQTRSVIESLIALVSQATVNGRPFLQVRFQIWARELARMVATLEREPKLISLDDLSNKDKLALPLIVCKECNHAGWGSFEYETQDNYSVRVSSSANSFYRRWFSGDHTVSIYYPIVNKENFEKLKDDTYLIDPDTSEITPARKKDWEEIALLTGLPQNATKRVSDKKASNNSQNINYPVLVYKPDLTVSISKEDSVESSGLFERTIHERGKYTVKKFRNLCPFCRTMGSLVIFGSSVSTLTSAGVSAIASSKYGSDPKILAFSDSVQDASQRAGFLEARGYRSSVRHAIWTFLNSRGTRTTSFKQLLGELPKFWEAKFYAEIEKTYPNLTPKEKERLVKADFVATFMPSDKQWWEEWKIFSDASEGTDTNEQTIIAEYENWKALYELSRQRLVWATMDEFGERSGSGRSLLKSGLASLEIESQLLKGAADDLAKKLFASEDSPFYSSEFYGSFRRDLEKECKRFLLSILDHLRSSGGFSPSLLTEIDCDEIEKQYERYLRTGDSFGPFNRTLYMPPRGPRMPPPVGVAFTAPSKDRYWPSLMPRKGQGSWFKDRAENFLTLLSEKFSEKNSSFKLYDLSYLNDFWNHVISSLTDKKLIEDKIRKDGTRYFVLGPKVLSVTTNLQTVRCNKCGKIYWVPGNENTTWAGMSCLSNDCDGTFDEDYLISHNNSLYAGDLVRLNAREHTGLLEGKQRLQIENSFKAKSNRWNVNFLSATPTLEMGVDIGSLSTVIQCSIPPNRTHYLQRVGRAGRLDGNSLVLTMIGRDNHSLYFWNNPEEMLQGDAPVPGVFLSAASVLERQLFAFAISKWSRENEIVKLAPHLENVLSALSNTKTALFPLSFLNWLENQSKKDEVLSNFFQLFKDNPQIINGSVKASLESFLDPQRSKISSKEDLANLPPDSEFNLFDRLKKALFEAQLSKENWRKNADILKDKVKRLEEEAQKGVKDENTKKLITEFNAARTEYLKLITNEITNKDLYAYLTDVGLLPNYAFPEEGVQVRSIILERKGEGEDRSFVPVECTFSRTAATAIGELVPPNPFYAFAHRLHVDRLRVGQDSFEHWRICPVCNHMEKILGDEKTVREDKCPVCGSPKWSDLGSVQMLMRMKDVTVRGVGRNDRITENDDRRTAFTSNKLLFIEPLNNSLKNKWQVQSKKVSFEVEYFSSVQIRELNLGPKDEQGGSEKVFGGKTVSASGFKVCRSCGKFYDPKASEKHDFTCHYFNKDDEEAWVTGLMLYRELKSEALRIRLPLFDSYDLDGAEIGTQSIIAALNLGLRTYFKGNIDHLRTDVQVLPNATGGNDRYLVIYDTVPGGTGYLKEIGTRDPKTGHPEVLIQIFKKAFEKLSECVCKQDPEKDGCYRCLYQFSNAYLRDKISRRTALDILFKIVGLDPKDYKEAGQSPSLPKEDKDFHLIELESFLEEMFVKRLSRTPGIEIRNTILENGKEGYLIYQRVKEESWKSWEKLIPGSLSKDQKKDEIVWLLEPQVEIGHKQGVKYPSRADFVLRPSSSRICRDHPELVCYIFTDGWKFHCKTIDEDVLQRQSIINVGHRVWSLTWEAVYEPSKEDIRNGNVKSLDENLSAPFQNNSSSQNVDKWRNIFKRTDVAYDDMLKSCENFLFGNTSPVSAGSSVMKSKDSFDRLVEWMENPWEFENKVNDYFQGSLVRLFPNAATPSKTFSVDLFTQNKAQSGKIKKEDLKFLCTSESIKKGFITQIVALRLSDKKFLVGLEFKHKKNGLEQDEQKAWQYFFDMSNIAQFSAGVILATDTTLDDPIYEHIEEKPTPPADDNITRWNRLLAESSTAGYEDLYQIVKTLVDLNIPYPDQEFLESWDEDARADPLGLLWVRNGKKLVLFPKGSLWEDRVQPSSPELMVLTDDDQQWQQKLLTFLS